MKKCMISIVLGCLMVMSVSGAAMAASAEPDALALSGVEVSSLAPVVMDGATRVAIVGSENNRAVADEVSLEDLPNKEIGNVEDGIISGVAKATSSVNWTIEADTAMQATTSFSLEADETVTINCSYSPRSASVDFGLIAPDGKFYYVSGSNGSINKTLRVTQRGQYYFAVNNNSDNTITVTGLSLIHISEPTRRS